MAIWCTRIAGCIPKAKSTQAEYVIFLALSLQQWLRFPPWYVVRTLPLFLTKCLSLKAIKIIAFKSIFVTKILKTEVTRVTFRGQRYKLPSMSIPSGSDSVDFPFSEWKNYTLHTALILPTVWLRYRNFVGKNCRLYALYVAHTPQKSFKIYSVDF